MKRYLLIIVMAVLFSISGSLIYAQQTTTDTETLACDATVTQLVQVVEQVCNGLGRDQVCYGNNNVNAIPREMDLDFVSFTAPGDFASLNDIRSIYLSELNTETDEWGIAQMRMLADVSSTVPASITMLLFGNTSLDVVDTNRTFVPVTVGNEFNARMRSQPNVNALVVDVANTNETVEAVSRLEDNSWVRIREGDLGRVGWVAANLLNFDDTDISTLSVEDGSQPYFNGMQALTFQTGTESACGGSLTDGMLIQTPQGLAEVTFLVNEVIIELTDEGSGTTAMFEGNSSDGMNLSMLDGSARVTVADTTIELAAGQRLIITLDETLTPTGEFTAPEAIGADNPVFAEIQQNLLPSIRLVNAEFNLDFTAAQNTTTSAQTSDESDSNSTDDATGEDEGTQGDFGCDQPGNSCNAPGQENGNNGNRPGEAPANDGGEPANNSGGDHGCDKPGNACNAPGQGGDQPPGNGNPGGPGNGGGPNNP